MSTLDDYPEITGSPRPQINNKQTDRHGDDHRGEGGGESRSTSSSATRKTDTTSSSGPKKPAKKRRLKITVQRPDVLQELADKLGLSKAGVFNMALSELADRKGLSD